MRTGPDGSAGPRTIGALLVAGVLALSGAAPAMGQAATRMTRASGLVLFVSGFRSEEKDPGPITWPEWTVMQGQGLMRIRLERQGSEWVDAGSTFTLWAMDTEAPFVDDIGCSHSLALGGVRRPSGPLIVNNGDGVVLEVDEANGTAELYVSGFSAPGRPEHAGEAHGETCAREGPWHRIDPPEAGWAVYAQCADGRLEEGGVIRFVKRRCISAEAVRHGTAEDWTARWLQGQIRLLP